MASECPDSETLQKLLLGDLPASQRETLGKHLLECDQCTATSDTIVARDDLTEAIRTQRVIDADDEVLSRVIQRGKQLQADSNHPPLDETLQGDESPEIDETHDSSAGATRVGLDEETDFLAKPEQPDEIGRLGGYRVLEILGAGGMGIVFKAEDPKLERLVALKAMKPAIASSRSAKERFIREAKATAAIDHHHIVQIYQVGEDGHVPFIAMQYLQGESLQRRLSREGKLDQRDVLRFGQEVAAGLQAAHDTGLIHRDIKPDNIWIDEKTGWAKILDFGLVRSASDDAGLTHSGTVLGTPRYMAPEQAMGEEVDHRSDLFSLGSVLYHLATGRPAFSGSNLTATLIAVAQADPKDVTEVSPDLHPDLARLIMRLLSKEKSDRPQSGTEVADALKTIETRLDREPTALAAGLPTENTAPEASANASQEAIKETPTPQPSASHGNTGIHRKLLIGGGFAALFLLAVIVFKFTTRDGTVVVELDAPIDIATIEIDDKEVSFSPEGTDKRLTFKVDPGNHKLTIKTTDGLELTTSLAEKPLEIKAGGNTKLRAWVEPKVVSKTPSAQPFEPDDVAERAAAEWWAENLRSGYLMIQKEDGTTTQITPGNRELPPGRIALTWVNENDKSYLDDSVTDHLAACRSLEGIVFDSGSSITNKGLTALTSITSLTTLYLSFNEQIDDRLWPLLSQWPNLQELGLGTCSGLSDPDPAALPATLPLRFLALPINITDVGLRTFQKHAPHIETLWIDSSILKSLESLNGNSSLKHIRCAAHQITEAGVAKLKQLPAFDSLTILIGATDKTIQHLLPLREKLRVLNIFTNHLGDGLMSTASYPVIAQLTEVSELSVYGNLGSPNDEDLITLSKLPHLSYLRLAFPKESPYPDFPDARRQYTEAGIETLRKARPDVRLDVDGVVYEPTKPPKTTFSPFPRPAYDPSPLPKLGTWEVGPEPPWASGKALEINSGHVLPGNLEQPATLPGIKRWNVDTFWPRGYVPVARYSPDGKWLALASYDGHVRLYDSETLSKCVILPGIGGQSGVLTMEWSPDGTRIALCDGGTVRIWKTDGTCIMETSLRGYPRQINWIGQDRLAVGVDPLNRPDHAFCVVLDQEGQELKKLSGEEELGINRGGMDVSSDGKQIVCRHNDGRVRIWDVETGKMLTDLCEGPRPDFCVAWSSTDWIAVATGQEIQLYGPDRKLQQTVPFGGGGLRWDSTGKKLLSATGPVRVWDTDSAAFVAPKDTDVFDGKWWSNGTSNHSTAHEWSLDGNKIIRAAGRLDVFDAQLETREFVSPQFYTYGERASWSPDGQRLLTACNIFDSVLWSTTGQRMQSIENHIYPHYDWSPDSKTLYSGEPQGLRIKTDGQSHLYKFPELQSLGCLSTNADGNMIAAAANTIEGEGVVAILSADGKLLRTIAFPDKQPINHAHHFSVDWSAATNLILVEHSGKYHIIDPDNDWKRRGVGSARGLADAFWNPGGTEICDVEGGHFTLDGTRIEGDYRSARTWRPDGKVFLDFIGSSLSVRDYSKVESTWSLQLTGSYSVNYTWNPCRPLIAINDAHCRLVTLDATDLSPYWNAMILPENNSVSLTPAGQIIDGDKDVIEKYVRYYVENDEGRIETLTPTEFEKRIGQSLYVPESPEPLVATTEDAESSGDATNEVAPATGAATTRPPPDDAERKELRTVLRDLIGIDVSRVTLLGELRGFAKNPTADDWSDIQKRAKANREKLVAGIQRLETLDSEFVIDEMASFRQILIDLNNKRRIYDGVIKMDSRKAIAEPARITRVADAYGSLIQSLRKHEQVIQKYLQNK